MGVKARINNPGGPPLRNKVGILLVGIANEDWEDEEEDWEDEEDEDEEEED